MEAPIHSRSKYIVSSQVQLTNILQLLGGLHVFWLLAVGSRDLSEVEKEITASKADYIHKMTTIFTQTDNQGPF